MTSVVMNFRVDLLQNAKTKKLEILTDTKTCLVVDADSILLLFNVLMDLEHLRSLDVSFAQHSTSVKDIIGTFTIQALGIKDDLRQWFLEVLDNIYQKSTNSPKKTYVGHAVALRPDLWVKCWCLGHLINQKPDSLAGSFVLSRLQGVERYILSNLERREKGTASNDHLVAAIDQAFGKHIEGDLWSRGLDVRKAVAKRCIANVATLSDVCKFNVMLNTVPAFSRLFLHQMVDAQVDFVVEQVEVCRSCERDKDTSELCECVVGDDADHWFNVRLRC